MKTLLKKLESPAFVIPGNWFLRTAAPFFTAIGAWGSVRQFIRGGIWEVFIGVVLVCGTIILGLVWACAWQELFYDIQKRTNKGKRE